MNRLAPGFLLGRRYSLVSLVATGGMGAVWRADDQLLERTVAIKVMHPHTAAERIFADRFRAEAQYAAKLTSPHIIGVYDFGEQDGLAYLVMEFVEGRTAAQVLAEDGPLDAVALRSLLLDVADALENAHERGIIHRDVKPSNIMIATDGRAKLGDFGIARAIEGVSETKTGEVLGTPQYLSPEQARGEPASPASDLYSLGVVAQELLTGEKPFDRGTPVATALAHIGEPPPPLPASLPPDLADAIGRCLAKNPAERPESARTLAELLGAPARSLAGQPARPSGGARRASSGSTPLTGRNTPVRPPAALALSGPTRVALASAATVVVVLLCLAAMFL